MKSAVSPTRRDEITLKMDTSPTQLRMVGKAWEIRYRLKQLLREHGEQLPLKQLLAPSAVADPPTRHLTLV